MACFEKVTEYPDMAFQGSTANYFNNRIILVGGYNGSAYNGLVRSSLDGLTFDVVAQGVSKINPSRAYHASCILDNRIFISSGYNGTSYLSDVWMSNDGQNFERVSVGNIPARARHAMFAYDNRLWILGGYNGVTNLEDCWCSYDGANWTKVNPGNIVLNRRNMGYCTFDNRMWIAGGTNAANANLKNVYSSINGLDWIPGQVPADFPALQGHSLTVFDNKMVLIGGDNSASGGTLSNDLWYSFHGQEWILGNSDLGFSREYHTAVAATEQQRLYVIGGYNGTQTKGDVFRTVGEEFLNRAW